METIDVPEVRRLPELSANEENAVAFADMVLTRLFDYDNALLYAEHRSTDSAVSWCIESRNEQLPNREIEVAISPTRGSFRSVLARFGHYHMGSQLYNGYALRLLRQGGRAHRCHIYMSNVGQSGF